MKKIILILLTILLLCMVGGCGSQSTPDGNSSSASDRGTDEKPETGRTVPMDEMVPTEEVVSRESIVDFPISDLVSRLNQFNEMTSFYYVSDHEAAILADKLYLLDLSVNEIKAEMGIPAGWEFGLDLYPLDDGYVVVADNADNKLECTWLDQGLNVQNKVNIVQTTDLEPVFTKAVSVSSDGKLLAVNDGVTGLYIFDLQTGKKEQVLTFEDISIVCALTEIAFTDHDQRIVFTGQRIPQNTDEGESVYGSVKLDGSDLFVEGGKDLSKITAYGTVVLIGQEVPDGDASGEAYVYLPASPSASRFSLTETKESPYFWGSQGGRYFGTSAKDKNGWTVRLYNMEDGTKVYESSLLYDTEQYRNPHIYIFDAAGIMILYFGPLGDNPSSKIEVIPFS